MVASSSVTLARLLAMLSSACVVRSSIMTL
jgi:hypothetical protein